MDALRKTVLFVSFLIMMFSIGIVIGNSIIISGYVETEATIIDIYQLSGTSGDSRKYIVEYEFMYQNKLISTSKQVFSKSDRDIGETEIIRHSQIKPRTVENTLVRDTGIVLSIFFFVFNVLLIILITKKTKLPDNKK